MKVAILGSSGYTGGELLRILLFHPEAEICLVASRKYAGMPVHIVHPNLRQVTDLRFEAIDVSKCMDCDVVFSALPHGVLMNMGIIPELLKTAVKTVDLSADYRLKEPGRYKVYYSVDHPQPELLQRAVYGLPELHRKEIRKADFVACPGCIPTAVILALAPIVKNFDVHRIVSDVKVGSSAAGVKPTQASHHAERSGVVRAYKLVGHRHTPEVEQELSLVAGKEVKFRMSAHAIDLVRGLSTTNYVFLDGEVEEKAVWRAFRSFYNDEPFVRVFKARRGVYRLADPKAVVGSNYADISFELAGDELIVVSAIDNLVKGSSGQAVQCWNIMLGLSEKTGLQFVGLHPV